MRLTLTLLGLELDITLGRTSNSDDDAPGSYTSYPVGFVRDPDVPWEDPGSHHQFDSNTPSQGPSPSGQRLKREANRCP